MRRAHVSRFNSTSSVVRAQIEAADERLWRYEDFTGLPISAVNQVLSRLTRKGVLKRIRKGLYYGPVRPNELRLPSEDAVLARALRYRVHPAGKTAAHLLGLIVHEPEKAEYATQATETPSNLPGMKVFSGRSRARGPLNDIEGAILETLRVRAASSEKSEEETIGQLLMFLRKQETFSKLVVAALEEPPRVRAILGALGQEIGLPESDLSDLRHSLNPLSRFDFGLFKRLQSAPGWQAK